MPAKIRAARLKDAAGYSRCFQAIANENRYGFELGAMPLAKGRAQMRNNLRKKVPFLVAVDGQRVVGWAAVYSSGMPSTVHCVDLGMGLLPEYREKGLGTKLLAGILRMCRGKFDSVFLTVIRKNQRARKLYRRMGFEPRGGIKNAVKTAYGTDDLLFMQKQLGR
jgi:ribosomal protein S18 acetylase RimI-like enzyme